MVRRFRRDQRGFEVLVAVLLIAVAAFIAIKLRSSGETAVRETEAKVSSIITGADPYAQGDAEGTTGVE
jgi:hypothetical protein